VRNHPRVPTGPFALRVIALLLLVIGGFTLGGRLRELPSDPHPGFARWYAGAWTLRSGLPLTDLYDDGRFARRVDRLAPASGLLRFAPTPPASVAPYLPFTRLALGSARVSSGLLAAGLVLASLWLLGLLAGGRVWERAEWLALTGAVFGSTPLARALSSGDPAPLLLFLWSVLFVAAMRQRWFVVAVCAAVSSVLSGIGPVFALGLAFGRARKQALLAAGAIAVAFLIAIAGLGMDAHVAWLSRLARGFGELGSPEVVSAPGACARLLGLLRETGISAEAPRALDGFAAGALALVLLVFAVGWSVRRLRASGGATTGPRRLAVWTTLALGFAPGASVATLLLAVVPLWAALRSAVLAEVSGRRWLSLALAAALILAPLPRPLAAARFAGLVLLWFWLLTAPDPADESDAVRRSAPSAYW